MTDIFAQLPNLGGVGFGGALVCIIAYLLRSNYNDRKQYRELLAAEEQSHRESVADSHRKIEKLDARVDDLQHQVDTERDQRRLAQDAAARAEQRAAIAEQHVAHLRASLEGRQRDTPRQLPAPQPRWATSDTDPATRARHGRNPQDPERRPPEGPP